MNDPCLPCVYSSVKPYRSKLKNGKPCVVRPKACYSCSRRGRYLIWKYQMGKLAASSKTSGLAGHEEERAPGEGPTIGRPLK